MTTDPPARRARRRWLWWAGLGTTALIGGVIGGVIVSQTGLSGPAGRSASCPATAVSSNVLPSIVTISASRGQSAVAAQERSSEPMVTS